MTIVRRGLLRDYANTVCQIFTGWRLLAWPEDVPLLLPASEGSVHLDLLDGAATLNGAPTRLSIAQEIHLWLRERADLDGLGWDSITKADLTVDFVCREEPGRRKGVTVRELDLACRSIIETTTGSATGSHRNHELSVRQGGRSLGRSLSAQTTDSGSSRAGMFRRPRSGATTLREWSLVSSCWS